jgi:hypothetical protein
MIVKWSDGEVTLYQGGSDSDDRKAFATEHQLAKPGSVWTHARSLTTLRHGVVVLWDDGEVTLYETITSTGFGGEGQLQKPNALFRDHARHIAALDQDLIVVWSDGEVSLFSDVARNALTAELPVIEPNETWTHVRSLSSGYIVGTDWVADLIVRWSDGELTIYADPSKKLLGEEHQMQKPNDLWTHATIVAGTDDGLFVRWSDGELTSYPTMFANGFNREIQLVVP